LVGQDAPFIGATGQGSVLHVAVGSVVPLVMVILVVHPLKARLGTGLRYSMGQDLLVATLISWMFLFPGLIVQRLRNTAARIERRALLAQRAALEAQLSALQARISLAQRYRELPPLIFVTAHDDYAVRAFEAHAVDYLLKPVRPERLADALERARGRLLAKQAAVSRVLEAVAPVDSSCRIVTVSQGVFHFFDARSISRFWSSDKYTLFLAEQREQCTEESLIQLEERLRSHGFLRVHRGELIQLTHVKAVHARNGEQEVELQDGQLARVSRRSASTLKAALGMKAR
jgi:DNA-binding LytR/AlgR family response regulator